jgi:hypothetical protein
LFCCSCSSNKEIKINEIEKGSQAYAYLEIIRSRFPYEENKEYDRYIGINLNGVLYDHPKDIKKLIEDYVKEYDTKIIWNTNSSRYNFKRGSLIIFNDIELTESKLETEMICMFAPAFASSGQTYIVNKEAGQWTITKISRNWVS